MLNLISTLSLATALTLQPTTANININITQDQNNINMNSNSNLVKDDKSYAFNLYFLETETIISSTIFFTQYTKTETYPTSTIGEPKYIAIGFSDLNNTDIEKYESFNQTTEINTTITEIYYKNTLAKYNSNKDYSFTINIRSKTKMEELLTALTTAVQSAVSIFVDGFGGLTQIFYNGTEITFIGGILIVGLAVMFLMMFLRWIVSFVKGI